MWYVKYRLRDIKSGKTDPADYVRVPFEQAKSEAAAKTLALNKLRQKYSDSYDIKVVRIYFKDYRDPQPALLAG